MIPAMTLQTWLRLAAHPATVRRARITSLIVGTILGAINHGPALLAGQLSSERFFQIFLTFLVPYTVSTLSSVATRQELRCAPTPAPVPQETIYGAPDQA